MHQIPLDVWNDIAASQPLYPPMRELFKVTPQALAKMIDKHLDKPAEAAGLDNRTTLAFRLTLPLWLENEAISAYIQEYQRLDVRAALPELTSLRECLQLAVQEYRLDHSQLMKLQALLVSESNRISSEAMASVPARHEAMTTQSKPQTAKENPLAASLLASVLMKQSSQTMDKAQQRQASLLLEAAKSGKLPQLTANSAIVKALKAAKKQ